MHKDAPRRQSVGDIQAPGFGCPCKLVPPPISSSPIDGKALFMTIIFFSFELVKVGSRPLKPGVCMRAVYKAFPPLCISSPLIPSVKSGTRYDLSRFEVVVIKSKTEGWVDSLLQVRKNGLWEWQWDREGRGHVDHSIQAHLWLLPASSSVFSQYLKHVRSPSPPYPSLHVLFPLFSHLQSLLSIFFLTETFLISKAGSYALTLLSSCERTYLTVVIPCLFVSSIMYFFTKNPSWKGGNHKWLSYLSFRSDCLTHVRHLFVEWINNLITQSAWEK